MDSQWIASRRHQVRKHVPFLVTSSLHVSRSPYSIYAAVTAPHFFILWHKECAIIHSFSHQPLPPPARLLILQCMQRALLNLCPYHSRAGGICE
jgi:hypothetical protein